MKNRILLVDDEIDLIKTVQTRLEQANYEVLIAHDGMEALDKARKDKPDLIILDLLLPKMDGYRVCAFLKRDANYAKIPIIMFSACVQESDKDTGKEVGADDYITKPFQHQVLLKKISELLKK